MTDGGRGRRHQNMSAAREVYGTIRVLVVEDVAADVRLIQEQLRDAGAHSIEIESVGTLADGTRVLAQGGIDVVLLDLGLPDSQGLDTLTSI